MRRSLPPVLLLGVLFGGLLLAQPPTAQAGHPAYERLLARGTSQLEQNRPADAARTLEVAAFGLLDDPPRRAEALVRLGLAQAALEESEAFLRTVDKLDQVASRFDAWRTAELTADERGAFQTQAARLLSAQRREELAWLTPAPEQIAAAGETEAAGGTEADVDPPAAGAADLTAEEAAVVSRARDILGRARRARELDQALSLVRQVADAHPGRRELQHLTAEIAYRSSRWQEAVSYFERGGTPGADSPELRFYLAVALYETGRRQESRQHLEAVLPLLERTDFVESYRQKILTKEGAS